MGALAQQSARSSFGQYVKQKRVERPAADPVGAAIEEATREQREASALEAQQSSLSAFSQSQLSLNAGKARGKFGVRVKDRLKFEASIKPGAGALKPEASAAGSDRNGKEGASRPRTPQQRPRTPQRARQPMVITASPSVQHVASAAAAGDIEASASQVYPFANDGSGGGGLERKPSVARSIGPSGDASRPVKAAMPTPKFPPVRFFNQGGGGERGGTPSEDALRERLARLAMSTEPEASDVAQETSAPPTEAGDAAVTAGDAAASQPSVPPSRPSTAPSGRASPAPAGRQATDETTSELKASILKLSSKQVARWKNILRNDTMTPQSWKDHLRVVNFNKAVAMLKERIYTKSSRSISAHFQALDVDRVGALDRKAFRKALDAFNLGDCLDDETAEMLMNSLDEMKREGGGKRPASAASRPPTGPGLVNYAQFTEALRMGRIGYISQPGRRMRNGPDPENPFGASAIKGNLPFGIMEDGEKNSKIYGRYLRNLYRHVEGVFAKYDARGDGVMAKEDFAKALRDLSMEKGLKLSEDEIQNMIDDERMAAPGGPADISPPRPPAGKGQKKTKESVVAGPGSGKVLYANFLKEFKGDDQSWTIPEFLKPKALRRSQTGHPWSWTVQG